MTEHVLCKMTHLCFEMPNHWLLNLKSLTNSVVGQVPKPHFAMFPLAGTPARLTSLARFQALIEYFVNISKVKCQEVGHLQSAGQSSYKVSGQSS